MDTFKSAQVIHYTMDIIPQSHHVYEVTFMSGEKRDVGGVTEKATKRETIVWELFKRNCVDIFSKTLRLYPAVLVTNEVF